MEAKEHRLPRYKMHYFRKEIAYTTENEKEWDIWAGEETMMKEIAGQWN